MFVVGPDLVADAAPLLRMGLSPIFIPNGIDTDTFTPPTAEQRVAARAKYGLRDEFVVVYIGHEFDRKRLDLCIRALPHTDRRIILRVIGGRGASRSTYEKLARDLGVGDRVRFWGTRSDVASFLRIGDCFLLPSDYEAWPLVVLEALACGLPVIMTPVGCALHVIHDGRTGFIVGAGQGDVALEIAERIGWIARDDRLLSDMRGYARAEAEKYAWPRIVDRYYEVIRSVTARRAV